MKSVLFLDDEQRRHDSFAAETLTYIPKPEVTYVKTVQGAIHALKIRPQFDLVSLDHDLGDFSEMHESTGYDVAIFITTELPVVKRPKHVIVHSHNEERAKAMVQLLQKAGISARWIKFSVEG